MGNVPEGEEFPQYDPSYTIDKLDQAIKDAEAWDNRSNRLLTVLNRKIFDKGVKWTDYDGATAETKKRMKLQFKTAIKSDPKFMKEITEHIRGIGGANAVAKAAFRARAEQFGIAQLGFEKLPTNKSTLAGRMKNYDVTIVSAQANCITLGNIELKLKLRNNTSETIHFDIKMGSVFEPEEDEETDGEIQDLGSNETHRNLYIHGYDTKEFTIKCSCIDKDAKAPKNWINFKPTLLKHLDFEAVFIDEIDQVVNLSEKNWKLYDKIDERLEKLKKFLKEDMGVKYK